MTAAQRRTLGLIAQNGAARREWASSQLHSWAWMVGPQPLSATVNALYSYGFLEPDNGDPHRLRISDKGLRALGATPLAKTKAA